MWEMLTVAQHDCSCSKESHHGRASDFGTSTSLRQNPIEAMVMYNKFKMSQVLGI